MGCESCHGAGSEHAAAPLVADRVGGTRRPLRVPTEQTCLPCHRAAHGQPFVYASALTAISHPTTPVAPEAAVGRWTALAPQAISQTLDEQYGMAASKGARWFLEELAVSYKNPVNLAFRPDGREVWVACEGSGTVVIVDASSRMRVGEVTVGRQAHDVAFTPDGTRAYVSNRLDDTVTEVEVATRKVLRAFPVGDEPHGLLVDSTGRTLFVSNTASGDVSVIDLASGRNRVAWSPADRRGRWPCHPMRPGCW